MSWCCPKTMRTSGWRTDFICTFHSTRLRRMQVLEEAGGWRRVLEQFESDHIGLLDRYPSRFMVMLIDFDNNDDRLDYARQLDQQWHGIAAIKPIPFGIMSCYATTPASLRACASRCVRSYFESCPRLGGQVRAAQENHPLVRTILPSAEPDARSSRACRASRSGNVRVTSGSIFFSASSAKILARSSFNSCGFLRYNIVMP